LRSEREGLTESLEYVVAVAMVVGVLIEVLGGEVREGALLYS
jgi:hypothetical protein